MTNLQFFMGETQESFAFVDVAGAGGDKKLSKVQILVGLAPSKKNIFSWKYLNSCITGYQRGKNLKITQQTENILEVKFDFYQITKENKCLW